MNFRDLLYFPLQDRTILMFRQFLLQILVGVPTFLETIEMCPPELIYLTCFRQGFAYLLLAKFVVKSIHFWLLSWIF